MPVNVALAPPTVPVNVGLALMANVVPVPTWAAIDVAFPLDVIGPVKFAFVVTVPAVRADAVPVRFAPETAGRVVLSDGTPDPFVTMTALFTGAM